MTIGELIFKSARTEAWECGCVPPEDREPPTIPDILARAAVAASPRFVGSLSILYEGTRDRYFARGAEVLEEVASSADPITLEQRLAESPQLDAALAAAVVAASSTGLDGKRRLLARVITEAVLDDALVDDATLMVGVLTQVDAPHEQ